LAAKRWGKNIASRRKRNEVAQRQNAPHAPFTANDGGRDKAGGNEGRQKYSGEERRRDGDRKN